MIDPNRKYKIIDGYWHDTRTGQPIQDHKDIDELDRKLEIKNNQSDPKKYDAAIQSNKQILDVNPGNKEASKAIENLASKKNEIFANDLGFNNNTPEPTQPNPGSGYIENADGTGRVSIEDLLGLPKKPSIEPQAPSNNNSGFFDLLSKNISPQAAQSGSKVHNVSQGARSLDELESMSSTPSMGNEVDGLLKQILNGTQDLIGGSAFDITQAIKNSGHSEPVFGKDSSNPSFKDQIFNTKYSVPKMISGITEGLVNRISQVFSSDDEKQQAIEIVKQEKAKGRTDEQIAKDLDEEINKRQGSR